MEKRKTVLIVDDDEIILRTFTRILTRSGYNTENAASGEQAMLKLLERNYDAAIVDVRLPDENGVELLARMPATAANMVKIIITGFPTIENHRAAERNGADAYVEKPVDPEKLLRIVAEKMEEKERRTSSLAI